jgi:hypothetical protein
MLSRWFQARANMLLNKGETKEIVLAGVIKVFKLV